MKRTICLAGLGLFLATGGGCSSPPPPASAPPSGGPSLSASAATQASPSGATQASSGAPVSVASTAPGVMLETRLFGRTAFTARPRALIDPLEVRQAPKFERDAFAWNPEEAFKNWLAELDTDKMSFGNSLHEVPELLPALSGLTVADVGAGYGNNLLEWKRFLGKDGRLVETEVDINAARFMAYAAQKKGYADNTLVIHNVFEDPCLPVERFDIVLCSQLHSHITMGQYPRNAENEKKFYEQSRVFLGAIRRSLKRDGILVVIEGFQNYKLGPDHLYLRKEPAIENIERNGFKLAGSKQNDHLWAASFRKD